MYAAMLNPNLTNEDIKKLTEMKVKAIEANGKIIEEALVGMTPKQKAMYLKYALPVFMAHALS